MQRVVGKRSRRVLLFATTLVIALLGAACVPSAPPDPSGPTPAEQFCQFWDEVAEAPPALDNAVLVKDDVVALAEETTVSGQQCTDVTARVDLDAAIMAEGEEVPSELGEPEAEPIAAVTGEEIGPGQPVLENLSVNSLSASIGSNGITLRGNVAVRMSGVTSTIGFVGTLSSLDNWSISLSSAGLSIPGITNSPATFNGTLSSRNGVHSLELTALATSAKIGDVTVNGASVKLFASTATGVSASVQGAIKVGPSTVSGTVDVDFNPAGALVSANADLTTRLVGTQADGKKIDLQGSVKLEGNADETVASFSGSGVVGDLVVHEANGSLSLATNKATFVGVLDVEQGANTLRFNGSIVWDGITAYTPFLNVEGAGEISGTLNDGQTVSANGTIEATVIGGQLRSVVTGAFQLGTLKASGSAIVETNGATTTLEVNADLVDAGFAGTIEGAVVITDGRAELVNLDASVDGALTMGDVTVNSANLSVRSTYGSPLDVSFSGNLKIGSRADLNGSVDASIGPNGTLLSLRGDLNGSLALDSWAVVNYSGSVVATVDQVTLTGAGDIVLANFPAGLRINGTLTSSLTEPTWSLNGSGRFRIGSIDIASARLQLSQQAGMRATRVGFYFSIIGIPTYFEGNFFLKPQGGCDKVDITGGNLIAKLILVTVMPNAIGCPVNI